MFSKLMLLVGAILLFCVSKFQFQEIAETGCVRAKFGYQLCDWTKYAWAATPSIFGLLCIWTAFGRKREDSITRE